MRNHNTPNSDKIVNLLQRAGFSWLRIYREPRKGAQFIDGYSLKLYCCNANPETVQKFLERNGFDGVFVRATGAWNYARPGIAITWEV